MPPAGDFFKRFLGHQKDLRAFIDSVVFSPAARDDIFQEVALTLWEQADRYDPARPFGAWARGIAANKILQHRRQDARFPLLLSPEAVHAVREGFDRTEGDLSRKAEAFRKCIEELPEGPRRLLRLKFEELLPAERIARTLGRTVNAVYQALYRIRERLDTCMRRRMALEDLHESP